MTTPPSPPLPDVRRRAWVKAALWLVLVIVVVVVALQVGVPEVDAVRERVEEAGPWGPIVFVVLFVGVSLLPVPKNVLTVAGGAIFGLLPGAALALVGATIAAMLSFAGSRLLGRGAVEQVEGGRVARLDDRLRDHGFVTVLVLRLLPVVPYTGVNYAAGLSAVRVRSFFLATAVGMVPGTLAYAALGAFGTSGAYDRRLQVLALGVLLGLLLLGAVLTKVLGRSSPADG